MKNKEEKMGGDGCGPVAVPADRRIVCDRIDAAKNVDDLVAILREFGKAMDVSTQSFFLVKGTNLQLSKSDWGTIYDLTPDDSILEYKIESLLHFLDPEEETPEERLLRIAREGVKLPKQKRHLHRRRA